MDKDTADQAGNLAAEIRRAEMTLNDITKVLKPCTWSDNDEVSYPKVSIDTGHKRVELRLNREISLLITDLCQQRLEALEKQLANL